MADVNRGNRPLSPHLTVFDQSYTGTLSILHRITGIGLSLATILVVWWFLAAATDAAYFAFVDGLITSWLGGLVMIVSLWALWYHFCTGIRHLWWDTGRGFGLEEVRKSGMIVLGGSGVLTVLTLIAAFS
ncbi:succinate dehydrogenase, cytochrome b556 subunit [Halovulum dunhuangense]|uniref:Succinate dehydrogenase cytochrome b556 subunit n=1 Tax=Halovulum dunhuangense TaxID=1505036 RepID=A0A849KYT2_9RHOB|nr:succinate dehydrogenase, cytochrome b556 subunit [Halovulum dunhuangense]NNU78922.1 succinate dehydrogenase, cytochrome b556 subunit [Halovulum dunhuangense]